jgi:hypothetical protein
MEWYLKERGQREKDSTVKVIERREKKESEREREEMESREKERKVERNLDTLISNRIESPARVVSCVTFTIKRRRPSL